MRGRGLAAASSCVLLLAVGCSEQLERQSLVTGLRVLALVAEPPEVAPGESVVVSASWHDDRTAAPSFRWSRCAAPADGSIEECAGPESSLAEGEGVDQVSFVPEDEGTVLIRLSVCAAPSGDRCGREVQAVKRVIVGEVDRPNHNPVIDTLRVTLPAEAGDAAEVELVAAPGSVESSADGTNEALFVSWYATAGSFDDDRSFGPEPLRFEGAWTPPAEASEVVVWAVLRDGRGGVAWSAQTVRTIEGR